MGRVSGKVAIVTGAASTEGIGFAAAKRLAAEGAKLVITDLDEEAISARAAELVEAGGEAIGLKHDVTDEGQWADVIQRATDHYGKLDILVNNAGVAILLPTDQMTVDQWHKQIDTNLLSVFLGCNAAIRQMRGQENGGSIVNISSIAGITGAPGAAAYCASKGGSRLFTKAVALENAALGIRVNSVHPGVIWTEMQAEAASSSPGLQEAMTEAIPMKRMGHPDDIAGMILFLASDEAGYITGGEYVVDGGLTAQ
jgi:NAD(P)-dependent dehydrogenase (short-subunit alcohol dehydrogenase family)